MATYYVDNTLHTGANASGTATGGGSNHILLADDGVQVDDVFVDYGVMITAGTGAGQHRRITAYDHTGHANGERCATVHAAWTTAPDGTSAYEITVGCDENTGAGMEAGSGGPWRTLDRAMNAIAGAGTGPHTIHVRGGRDYAESAAIDTAGQTGKPVTVAGFTSVPGDGGVATLNGGSSLGSALTGGSSNSVYYTFRHLRFVNYTSNGVDLGLALSLRFIDCVSENNGLHGFSVGHDSVLLNCRAAGNASSGFSCGGFGSVLSTVLVGCVSAGNGGQQYQGGSLVMVFCTATGIPNGRAGVGTFYSPDGVCLINCTMDGTGSTSATGVQVSGGSRNVVINCALTNLDRGIYALTGDPLRLAMSNLFFNCASGELVNYESLGQDVVADPQYVDVADGDVRVRATSPALRTGWPAQVDMGALQHGSRTTIGGPCQFGVQG